jgi:hypothetical protein
MANPKRPRDPNERAKLIVDIATGESDEPKAPKAKDPAAVELGRRGGKARAKKLKPEERSEMLLKIYGQDPQPQRRYSPAVCTGSERTVITGDPDPAHISTSYIEWQNLTMGIRRFTRLTNGFSKKIENHAAAVALHLQFYNFARPHKSLKNPYPRTPAMAAGIEDYVWSLEDIAALIN